MADRTFNLTIRINGEDNVSAMMDNVGKKASGLGSILTNAAGVAGGIVLAKGFDLVAGAVTNAIQSAATFETAMRNVNSIAKLNDEGFAALSDKVIALTKEVPQSAETLAKGLYDIQSSGFAAKDAMVVLEAAARGASAGLSTTDVAASGLTAVLNAYGKGANESSAVMDVMFKTVDRGVLSFEELASNVGDIVGTANVAGVSFEQVGAAMATMTKGGVSAAESATALNQLMLSFISPSAEAANAAARLGVDLSASALASKGLGGVMEEIRKKTGGSAEAMAELFPNVRALKGALALTRGEGKMFAEDMAAMGAATGATAAALAEQSKATAFQWQLLQNNLQAGALELGGHLLPVMNQFIQFILKDGLPALGAFKDFLGAQLMPIFRDVWGMVQPILAQLGAGFTTFFEAIRTGSSPFAALVLALQSMGMSFQQSVGVMETVKGVLAAIGGFIATVIVPAFQQWLQWQVQVHTQLFSIASSIGAQVLPLLQRFAAWVIGTLVPALSQMGATIATAALPTLQMFAAWVTGSLLPALQQLGMWLLSQIVPALETLGGIIISSVIPALTQIAVFIFSTLLPAFGGLVNWLAAQIPVAVAAFQNTITALQPFFALLVKGVSAAISIMQSLSSIWQALNRIVQTFMGWLTNIVLKFLGIDTSAKAVEARMNTLGAVLNTIGGIIRTVVDGVLKDLWLRFEALVGVLEAMAEWLSKIADMLANLDVSKIFKPGSPSMMEVSFSNLVEHMKEMAYWGKHATAWGQGEYGITAPWQTEMQMQTAGATATPASAGRAVTIQQLVIQPHDYADFMRQFENATGIEFAMGTG